MSESILYRPPPPAERRLPYGDDPLQFGDLRLPVGDGPHPAVIAIHGGFWRARYDLTHLGHLCQALTAAGFATWSIEYRRVGDPGGGWPGTFLDVAHGAAHLFAIAPDYNVDPTKVIALGHSAGGHLALWLAALANVPADSPVHAARLPLSGAVSLAGVLDLDLAWRLGLSNDAVGELLGGSPSAVPERYAAASPLALLPLGERRLIVHGTVDEPVPFEIAAAYHQAAIFHGDDATLLALPDTGHFEVIDPDSAAWPAILSAVRTMLALPE